MSSGAPEATESPGVFQIQRKQRNTKALSDSCYAPTVLFDPPADSRVMTREVFGPVVCVSPVDTIDEAITAAISKEKDHLCKPKKIKGKIGDTTWN